MPQPAGYSGRTLIQKIGLKPNQRLAAIDPPADYAALMEPLPEGASIRPLGADDGPGDAAVVHLFVRGRGDLERAGPRLAAAARPGTALWISWPKKASPLFAGVTEDSVREVMLPTGWVDVKVAAVDADWSALKLLRRRA